MVRKQRKQRMTEGLKLDSDDQARIVEALEWFGEPADHLEDCDITESGEVWLGLFKILPAGSVQARPQ